MKRTKFNGDISNRQKYVHIDSKTVIVVPVETPDDVARSNYLTKTLARTPQNRHNGMDEFIKGINFFR
jgi:hypothetical protein